MTRTKPCRICDGTATPWYDFGHYNYYRCESCRSAFLDPVPTADELELYYATYHQSTDDGGAYDWIEDRIARTFPAKIRLVRDKTGGKPGRLLDVGCGKGVFVKACVERGIDAFGVDLSRSGVDYAVQKLGVRALCGDVAELKPQLGVFDTATCWATVEHLPDAGAVLSNVRDVLRPGGTLFLLTCAGDSLVERMLPGATEWFIPPQHLVIFSASGIKRTLEASGFEVRSIEMNWEYHAARRLARLGRNLAAAVSLRLLFTLLRLHAEPPFLARYPIGNEMMVIARRR